MAAPDYQADLLDTINVVGAILEKVGAAEAEKEAQAQRINVLVPQAVEALLANERIEPAQKEAAANALRDPSRVLEILIKTAYHRNHSEQIKVGQPVAPQVKRASVPSTQSAYVGDRRPRLKESDLVLMSRLGIEPPTEE
jgi:hypothetical protein